MVSNRIELDGENQHPWIVINTKLVVTYKLKGGCYIQIQRWLLHTN